jgi:hypothetical protein
MTTHLPVAPALPQLCRAPRLPVLGRIGSTSTTSCAMTTRLMTAWALPRLRLASWLLATRLHQLYCAYVVHPDAPSSPLDFSSVGRTGSRRVPGHPVSQLGYTPVGCTGSTTSSLCIRTRRLRRSTSRQSVALALAMCPVTPSRDSATRHSVAPALLRLHHASGRAIFVARLLVSRSHGLSSCARSFCRAPRLPISRP